MKRSLIYSLTPFTVSIREGVKKSFPYGGKEIGWGLLLWLITFSLNAQTTVLQGSWKLESITRNEGSIVFYDAVKNQAAGYPPVAWAFTADTIAMYGDLSVPANNPGAYDLVESNTCRFSGDTLILTQYYTKGVELATITNAPMAYYRLDKASLDSFTLIMYDMYPGHVFRPIDKYSRTYVFSRMK